MHNIILSVDEYYIYGEEYPRELLKTFDFLFR